MASISPNFLPLVCFLFFLNCDFFLYGGIICEQSRQLGTFTPNSGQWAFLHQHTTYLLQGKKNSVQECIFIDCQLVPSHKTKDYKFPPTVLLHSALPISLTLTCFIATSPILAECLRMFSRKSFRSIIEASLILLRSWGIASAIVWENQ